MSLLLDTFRERCRAWHRYGTKMPNRAARIEVYVALLDRHDKRVVLRHMPQIVAVLDRAEQAEMKAAP